LGLTSEDGAKTFVNVALTRCRVSLGLAKRFLLLGALFAASIYSARSSETSALIDRPNADAAPTRVSTEIWAVDISNIDSAQQSFVADVAVGVALERKLLGAGSRGQSRNTNSSSNLSASNTRVQKSLSQWKCPERSMEARLHSITTSRLRATKLYL
jgi:hypothetical protein